MSLLGRILFFAGYTFEYENSVNVAPLDIELGIRNTYIAKQRSPKKEALGRKILTTLYEIFIFVTIMWSVIYGLYMSIRDKDISHFGRTWFQILFALQYYYAIKYFAHNHFYENIVCNKNLHWYISISVPLSLFISFVLAIMNVVLLNHNYKYHVYDEIYNNTDVTGKVFLSIALFMDSIYSYLTFTVNACVFSVNMLYHRTTVTNYAGSLTSYIKNSINTVRKLNNVAVEYAQMKNRFDNTVTLLTPFFSTLNFIGFITIYFYLDALNNNKLSVMEYINLVLFFVTEFVYLISIQAVNTNINNIGDIITSNSVITTFFGHKQFSRNMPINDLSEKDGPSVMNEEMDDIKLVDPIKSTNDDDINEITEKQNKNFQNVESPNTGMIRQIMVSTISTDQMMDWLLLRDIINNRWRTFRIFGVEFTDTRLIAKLFGIFVTILMSAQIGFILNWW